MNANRESTLTSDGHVSEWFAKIIFATAEAFGMKLTEARIRIYAADLADFTREQVERAFTRCRREGSGFFPSVPELRKQIGPSQDDAALLAWSALIDAAAQVGAYSSIEIEDPHAATALVMTFGTWSSFCAMETGPELLTKRQEFLAAYREARRTFSADKSMRLSGLLESTGTYEYRRAVWTARLTARGDVIHEREHQALVTHEAKQLTDGD